MAVEGAAITLIPIVPVPPKGTAAAAAKVVLPFFAALGGNPLKAGAGEAAVFGAPNGEAENGLGAGV